MSIDIERLRVFLIVAQEGGITKASLKLHIDKSSVSRHLQILESVFGKKLFSRSRDGLCLTREGQYVMEKAQQVLDQVKSLKICFEESSDGPLKGVLRVNSTHALTATWLTMIMEKFIGTHPHLQFEIFASNEVLDLINNDFDLAIRPYIVNAPHLVQEPLMRWRLQLYASHEYLKKFGLPNTPEDLDKHRLIVFGDSAVNFLPRSYTSWPLYLGVKNGQSRKPFILINSVPGMYNLVQAGIGIGCFAKESPLFKKYQLLPVLPHLPGTEVEVCYIYPESNKFSAKIRLFRDYLKQEINKIKDLESISKGK